MTSFILNFVLVDSILRTQDKRIIYLDNLSTAQKIIVIVYPFQFENIPTKSKIDRQLNRFTQAELISDIKNSIRRAKEPAHLESMITEDMKCKVDATTEAQLWLIIKKQEHLNSRLLENVVQNKKHVEVLQKNVEQTKSSRQDMDQNIETYKYIVKCLQEKLATLEEQIEILTAVESR